MKKLPLLVSGLLMAMAGTAFSANLVEGVTESTDPAAAAAVEQHADALRTSSTPMEHGLHHYSRHHAMHHAKQHTQHHMMHHDTAQPAADTMSK